MSKSIDPHILPPQQVLITYSRELPDFWADVESARTFFQGKISWPPYVYTPAACIAKLLERGGFDMEALPDTTISILAALAAWRLGQDIYRIDPDLYTDLFDSEIDCDIPHEVFFHLPSWCCYVETPGWIVNENGPKADSVEICGFFAFVDYEPTKEKLDVLHLIPISKDGSECMPCRTFQLELTPGFLTKAITQKIQPDGSKMTTWKYLEPMLNLLLYICTAVDDLGDHGKKPQFPVPVKTKKGLKYFQPDKPAVWDCGVRIGAALRASREAQGETIQPQESSSPHRRSPRPHMRRAYWKAVWRGPLKNPGLREKYARWFPPAAVNMKDAGDLPAVIHPVLKG